MYKKVPTTLNFVEREKETLKFWKDNQIFEKSVQLRQGAPAYTFFDGPPTANGKPHIGHVLTRAMAFPLSWRWKKSWASTAKSR